MDHRLPGYLKDWIYVYAWVEFIVGQASFWNLKSGSTVHLFFFYGAASRGEYKAGF